MQRSGFYLAALALCCLNASSAPSGYVDACGVGVGVGSGVGVQCSYSSPSKVSSEAPGMEETPRDDEGAPQPEGAERLRRDIEKDGLALSREIFRNITKQLRQSIAKDPNAAGEKLDHLLQNKIEEHRYHGPYQGLNHHEHHWGPYFEGESSADSPERPVQVTGHVGSEALLSCRVGMLKDKTVMWLRRTVDAVQLLTVGAAAHSGDQRVGVKFQYPNNWRLSIDPVRRSDAGLYMCQISTHPPRAILANLTVLAPILTINGDQTHEVKDRYYKTGSSIELSCVISPVFALQLPLYAQKVTKTIKTTTTTTTTPKTTTEAVTRTSLVNIIDLLVNKSWSVETTTLSTTSVSTVKLKSSTTVQTTVPTITTTEKVVVDNVYGLVWRKQGKEFAEDVRMANLSSTVLVASASQNDSGTYSCHMSDYASASVNVHVLIIGENQAAVHHDTGNKGFFWKPHAPLFSAVLAATFILT